MRDFLQPWKLCSFLLGLSWLIYGALNYGISDWDVGVSVIMAGLTYLTAPWSARVIMSWRWRYFLLVLFCYWFSVDGAYVLWHTAMGNEMLREANFYASSALYWLCGFIWLPRGSLRDILARRGSLY